MSGKFNRASFLTATLMVFAWVAIGATAKNADPMVVIATTEGPVRGLRANGVHEFLGIPYAAPPVGNLRWRPPEAHARWKTILTATRMGPSCPQILPGAEAVATSEDCLFLNIYAPDLTRRSLPVMVWIHGGAHTTLHLKAH
jgi:para-nitrobenzyl esterase